MLHAWARCKMYRGISYKNRKWHRAWKIQT